MNGKHLIPVAAGLVCSLALVGCSDRQQASQFFQDFTDTRHGPTGVIRNALSPGTGNPQADAALGAGAVIRNVERSDALESEATAARDKGDGATALVKIEEAAKLRPNPYTNLTQMGIAIQYAPPPSPAQSLWGPRVAEDIAMVQSRAYLLPSGQDITPEEYDYPEDYAYLDAGVAETERTLRALNQMTSLMPRERRQRQFIAANMARQFYVARALLNQRNGNPEFESRDRRKAELYGQMLLSLAMDEPGT